MKSLIAFLVFTVVGIAAIGVTTKSTHAYPGADNLTLIAQSCDGFGNVTGRFAWQAYNQGDQWLDVSTSGGGFDWYSFYGHGPFTVGQSSADRGWLTPSTIYYVRVNTAVFPDWISSNVLIFQTRACSASGTPSGSPAQTCDGFGGVTARFNWQSLGDGDHWLDVSSVSSSFDWGTFIGEGPFRPWQNTTDRGGLAPSTTYFYRLNAAVFPFWIASPTFSFQTISCTATPTPTPTSTNTPTNTPTPANTPTPTNTPTM